jgi:DNA-binding MarR family transcriptional regulator
VPTSSSAASCVPVPELAHALRIACMRVARRVRYEAGNTVPPHLFAVLVRLSEQPRTVGELAGIEQVSAPSMSRTVTQICEAGYAVRMADEHDGRLVRLALTPLGEETVRTEREHRDRWFTERLELLSLEDQQLLHRATELIEELVAR